MLAAIGLYGIMAYTVARRRNEIGIRVALGAAGSRIARLVLGDVARLVVVGVAIGVALSVATTRLIGSVLYGVTPNDPVTLAAAALLLAVVGPGGRRLPRPSCRAGRPDDGVAGRLTEPWTPRESTPTSGSTSSAS